MSFESIVYIKNIESGLRGIKKIRVKVFGVENVRSKTYTVFSSVYNVIKDELVVGTFAKIHVVETTDGYV